MKRIGALLLGLCACTGVWAGTANKISWEVFEQRFESVKDGGDEPFHNPINVQEIIPAIKSNPAKAGLKYGKPTVYVGSVKRVAVSNQNDADLILDAGSGNEITVILFPQQPHDWKKNEKGSWQFHDLEPTMEFAAKLDGSERFYFQCKKFVVAFGRGYLNDCIAFPIRVFE